MSDKVLVDTNILVYGYDADAGQKRDKTEAIIDALWDQSTGVLAAQVLAEFFITITRKGETSASTRRRKGNNRRLSSGVGCLCHYAGHGIVGDRRR